MLDDRETGEFFVCLFFSFLRKCEAQVYLEKEMCQKVQNIFLENTHSSKIEYRASVSKTV